MMFFIKRHLSAIDQCRQERMFMKNAAPGSEKSSRRGVFSCLPQPATVTEVMWGFTPSYQ